MTDRPVPADDFLPAGWRLALHDPALAEEFRQAPRGPHGDRLRRLLTLMQQTRPMAGKPVHVLSEDGESWLAEIPAYPSEPLIVRSGPIAGPPGDAQEIEAFALRWRALFGEHMPR